MKPNASFIFGVIAGLLIFGLLLLAASALDRFASGTFAQVFNLENLGTFGDFIGGVFNPIIGLVTILIIYRAYRSQKTMERDNKSMVTDQRKTRAIEESLLFIENIDHQKRDELDKSFTFVIPTATRLAAHSLNLDQLLDSLAQLNSHHQSPRFIAVPSSVKKDLLDACLELKSLIDDEISLSVEIKENSFSPAAIFMQDRDLTRLHKDAAAIRQIITLIESTPAALQAQIDARLARASDTE